MENIQVLRLEGKDFAVLVGGDELSVFSAEQNKFIERPYTGAWVSDAITVDPEDLSDEAAKAFWMQFSEYFTDEELEERGLLVDGKREGSPAIGQGNQTTVMQGVSPAIENMSYLGPQNPQSMQPGYNEQVSNSGFPMAQDDFLSIYDQRTALVKKLAKVDPHGTIQPRKASKRVAQAEGNDLFMRPTISDHTGLGDVNASQMPLQQPVSVNYSANGNERVADEEPTPAAPVIDQETAAFLRKFKDAADYYPDSKSWFQENWEKIVALKNQGLLKWRDIHNGAGAAVRLYELTAKGRKMSRQGQSMPAGASQPSQSAYPASTGMAGVQPGVQTQVGSQTVPKPTQPASPGNKWVLDPDTKQWVQAPVSQLKPRL